MGGGGTPVENVIMNDNAGAAPYAFSPATLTVKVGTTVKWTNNGGNGAYSNQRRDARSRSGTSGTVLPAGSTSCPPTDPYCQPSGTPPGTYRVTFNTAGT